MSILTMSVTAQIQSAGHKENTISGEILERDVKNTLNRLTPNRLKKGFSQFAETLDEVESIVNPVYWDFALLRSINSNLEGNFNPPLLVNEYLRQIDDSLGENGVGLLSGMEEGISIVGPICIVRETEDTFKVGLVRFEIGERIGKKGKKENILIPRMLADTLEPLDSNHRWLSSTDSTHPGGNWQVPKKIQSTSNIPPFMGITAALIILGAAVYFANNQIRSVTKVELPSEQNPNNEIPVNPEIVESDETQEVIEGVTEVAPIATEDPYQQTKELIQFKSQGVISFKDDQMIYEFEGGSVSLDQVSFLNKDTFLLNMGDLGVFEFGVNDIDLDSDGVLKGIAGFKFNDESKRLEVATFEGLLDYNELKANPLKFFNGYDLACRISPTDLKYLIKAGEIKDAGNNRNLPNSWNGIKASNMANIAIALEKGTDFESILACGLEAVDSVGNRYLFAAFVNVGPNHTYFATVHAMNYYKFDKNTGKYTFIRNETPDDIIKGNSILKDVLNSKKLYILIHGSGPAGKLTDVLDPYVPEFWGDITIEDGKLVVSEKTEKKISGSWFLGSSTDFND